MPKLAQHAFLRAKVKNDSPYPFLAGPANVFLDQSYVTETMLNSVSPNEEFSCSLGMCACVCVCLCVCACVHAFLVEKLALKSTY